MDRITKSALDSFSVDEQLGNLDEATAFEHFSAFSVLTPKIFERFALEDVSVGNDSLPGIDSMAIVVNGTLVPTLDDLDSTLENSGTLEVDFYFIQTKTGTNFQGALMADFADEVRSFFLEDNSHANLAELRAVTDRLLTSANRLKRNPNCHLYYVTTGRWQEDAHLMKKIDSARARVEDVNYFESVTFNPVDALQLQRLYRATKNKISAKFTFATKSTLPRIKGVEQSYLGVLPGKEFLKIIADENGDLHRGIFEDNVRDFQGTDNPVNVKIRDSIVAHQDQFAVLNNGVTIVAKDGRVLGDEITLDDFQIVNGCQTANVIYELREELDTIFVPLRVVITRDEAIATNITAATNSQTHVSKEDLYSLLSFQRSLEEYFATFDEGRQLHYERRSQQYQAVNSVQRSKIVTRAQLVKAFASTFLDEPHRATRYYTTLYRQLGERMFANDHKLEIYYASAVAQYRLEYLLRTGGLLSTLRPVRYHLLHAARHLALGDSVPEFNSKRLPSVIDRYVDVLWDERRSMELFNVAAMTVFKVAQGAEFTRDFTKQSTLTQSITRAAAETRTISTREPWHLSK